MAPYDPEDESGGFSEKEAARPVVKCVQPQSELSATIGAGKFMIADKSLNSSEIEFVIASVQAYWEEDRPYGVQHPTPAARFFNKADAEAWAQKAAGRKFKQCGLAIVFVRSDDEQFALSEMDGETWVACDWYLRGEKTWLRVITENMSAIGTREGAPANKYGNQWCGARLKYGSRQIKTPKGFFVVPNRISVTATTEALRDAIRSTGLTRKK